MSANPGDNKNHDSQSNRGVRNPVLVVNDFREMLGDFRLPKLEDFLQNDFNKGLVRFDRRKVNYVAIPHFETQDV